MTEQHRAQEQAGTRDLCASQSLHTIDRAILNTTDMHLALNTVLQETRDPSRCGMPGSFTLLNLHNLMLDAATIGLNRALTNHATDVRVGEGVTGTAGLEGAVVNPSDRRSADPVDQRNSPKCFAARKFQTSYAVPLIVKGNLIGTHDRLVSALLFKRGRLVRVSGKMIVGQTAIAIDSVKQFTDLQRINTELSMAYDTTIEGLVECARPPATKRRKDTPSA